MKTNLVLAVALVLVVFSYWAMQTSVMNAEPGRSSLLTHPDASETPNPNASGTPDNKSSTPTSIFDQHVNEAMKWCPTCLVTEFKRLIESDGQINPNGVKFVSSSGAKNFSIPATIQYDLWNGSTISKNLTPYDGPVWEASLRWPDSTPTVSQTPNPNASGTPDNTKTPIPSATPSQLVFKSNMPLFFAAVQSPAIPMPTAVPTPRCQLEDPVRPEAVAMCNGWTIEGPTDKSGGLPVQITIDNHFNLLFEWEAVGELGRKIGPYDTNRLLAAGHWTIYPPCRWRRLLDYQSCN